LAIPNIDTYLRETINTKMKALLKNPYIIREVVLSDIEDTVRDNFISTFCNPDSPLEIPVSYTFNRERANTGMILIQYKGAEEDIDGDGGSIGGVTGLTNDKNGNTAQDNFVWRVATDDTGEPVLMATAKQNIRELLAFRNISTTSIPTTVKDNIVTMPYDIATKALNGVQDKITYIPEQGQQVVSREGVLRGYDLTEVYTIDTISTNIDTLRCINNLLKVIFIPMRLDVEEQTEYRLAELSFSGLDLLDSFNSPTNSAMGEQLYYRRAEVSYGVTYSINTSYGIKIEEIDVLKQLLFEGESVSDEKKERN